MKLNYQIFITILLCFCFTFSVSGAKKKDKNPPKIETKKETAYDKLFKDKKVKTGKGLITLHLIEDKVYMELPLTILNKNLVLSSFVDRVSDMEMAYIGQRASTTSHIIFTQADSVIQMRLGQYAIVTNDTDQGIQNAIKQSNLDPVILSANVAAMSPDSSAVVFEITPFILEGNKFVVNLNSSRGMVSYDSRYKKETSSIDNITVFKDNVSIISDMSFTITPSIMGMSGKEEPFNATIRTTISLLPETPQDLRPADTRVGCNMTRITKYSANDQGSETEYFANRWRLEPSDTSAFVRRELVEPVQPIIFYIDSLFPNSWQQAIRTGVEKWNTAFEKIGYKNVLRALPYPANDSTFNANNIRYNCIKYSQTQSRAVGKSLLTDPRTGEILSASMYFSREMPVVLQRARLIQTGAVDPDVRDNKLNDKDMCDAITALMMRETGYCLGLAYNLAGTSSYPVDSLRSSTFTNKNGLTASVMDDILFNYVAQPGDKEQGAQLVISDLGVYDDFMIRWLYTPIWGTPSAKEIKNTLTQWIREKENDPRYRYGQTPASYVLSLDPRVVSKDLGDDVIKATKYAFRNLKYVSDNAAAWVDKEDTDESYKELFPDFIFLEFYDHVLQLTYTLGGVYLDEKYAGDAGAAFTPVPREKQKEVLMYLLDQCNDMTWIDNKEVLLLGGPNANMSAFCEYNTFNLLFRRLTAISLSSNNTDNPYSIKDMMGDISNYVLKKVRTGEKITRGNRMMLENLTESFLQSIDIKASGNSKSARGFAFNTEGISDPHKISDIQRLLLRCYPNGDMPAYLQTGYSNEEETGGFIPLSAIKYFTGPNTDTAFYMSLKEIKSAVDRGASATQDESLRNLYKYLSMKIQKTLNGK